MPPSLPDKLITIPAPHGFVGGPTSPDTDLGLVSLVFLPRLGDRGDFLDAWSGWQNWPRELAGLGTQPELRLAVAVNDLQFPIVVEDSRVRTAAWWQAVFPDPAAVPVTRFAFRNPAAGTGIDSYPQAEAATTLQDIDAAVRVAHPDARPTVGQLRATVGTLLDSLPTAEVRAYTAPRPAGPVADASVDFHQALAQLRRHPVLCRRLGLTVELVLNLSALRSSPDLPQDGRPWELQISTDWATRDSGREAAYPKVLVDPSTWRPAPEPGGVIKAGQLDLADDRFVIATGRTTATLLSFASLDGLDDAATAPLPTPPANPGIALFQAGIGKSTQDRYTRQQTIEGDLDFASNWNPDLVPESSVVLTAADIGAAYRVDVGEVTPDGTTSELRSLHDREAPDGYYTADPDLATPTVPPPPADENWMGTVLATAEGLNAPRLPEQLVLWLGWSMAAPLLGTVHDPGTGLPVPFQQNRPDPASPVQFGVDYEVPDRTLPKLRYGPTYRMRVRVVDIAGNSVPRLGEVTPILSDQLFYGRPDPVSPPTVLRRAPREDPKVPGAETLAIVLRSGIDDDDVTVPPQERMLFPPSRDPRDWALMEEPSDLHEAAGYQRLVGLDAKRLDDLLVADPATGEAIAATQSGATVSPGPTAPTADYLRDPAVAGVVFAGVPGADKPIISPYALAAPGGPKELRYVAQRLVVRAGDAPPTLDVIRDPGLKVEVPKACITTMTVASTIQSSLAARFFASSAVSATTLVEGGFWGASPTTAITLIHAIPNGRFDPTMPDSGTGEREALNATEAVVRVQMGMDVPATGAVTLRGRWEDPVDDPTQPAPTTRIRRAVLGTDDITYVKDATDQTVGVRYEFGDAIRHVVRVQGLAIARFTPHFVEPRPMSFTDGDDVDLGGPVVGATFSLRRADGGRVFTDGRDYRLDTDAGRLRRNPSGLIGQDEPLSAVYAEGPNTRSTLDGARPTTTVLVPNATVPALPDITAVQPAHERRQRRRWGAQLLEVDGRTLRLRLARPWLITGAEERLAVLVDHTDSGIPATTLFARDPIQAGESAARPVAADFPHADLTEIEVDAPMPDGTTVAVDVAGHAPVFDEANGDWVVDVVIDAPQYRPTIRLAVARYQPDSIDGAKLSSVILLDPVRLGVNRRIAVSQAASSTRSAPVVAVTVVGEDHDGRLDASGSTVFNAVVVTVQEADTAIADPDLRWRTTGTVVELARTAGEETTWAGEVPLPPAVAPLRLVVEELEPVVRDDGTGAGGVDDRDLVLVETIPVPEGVSGGR